MLAGMRGLHSLTILNDIPMFERADLRRTDNFCPYLCHYHGPLNLLEVMFSTHISLKRIVLTDRAIPTVRLQRNFPFFENTFYANISLKETGDEAIRAVFNLTQSMKSLVVEFPLADSFTLGQAINLVITNAASTTTLRRISIVSEGVLPHNPSTSIEDTFNNCPTLQTLRIGGTRFDSDVMSWERESR
ncbi:hypothetical protein GYMLUDRAFT_246819 [Collybiopsis luxurians FD-317 M1]|uniref:Uncharacterized protein n=1 Tax=Collybiopsis luxurians FD-317 M1 TaxID=944289 RepID=A0A0D0CQS8_9AGAR|nr:hypothetical protein GYMLUDRAFT_246819 [Collybiopsis luxurians FD-317 M1]